MFLEHALKVYNSVSVMTIVYCLSNLGNFLQASSRRLLLLLWELAFLPAFGRRKASTQEHIQTTNCLLYVKAKLNKKIHFVQSWSPFTPLYINISHVVLVCYVLCAHAVTESYPRA